MFGSGLVCLSFDFWHSGLSSTSGIIGLPGHKIQNEGWAARKIFKYIAFGTINRVTTFQRLLELVLNQLFGLCQIKTSAELLGISLEN